MPQLTVSLQHIVDEDKEKAFSNIKTAYVFAVIREGGIIGPFYVVRRRGVFGEVEHGSFELSSGGSATGRHFERHGG